MKVKNMYCFLDRLCSQNKSITINGEWFSATIVYFLSGDLSLCRSRDISIDDLRNGLETDYNNTSIGAILLEKKLLEFLLKI